MLEDHPPATGREGGCLGLIAGFCLGIAAGIFIPIVMFGLVSSAFGGRRVGLAVTEFLDLAILAAIGYYYSKDSQNSMLSSGVVAGISISFLLNVICGMAMISSR